MVAHNCIAPELEIRDCRMAERVYEICSCPVRMFAIKGGRIHDDDRIDTIHGNTLRSLVGKPDQFAKARLRIREAPTVLGSARRFELAVRHESASY